MRLIARLLEGLVRRVFGEPEPILCPTCIWISNDHGEIVEVIDCRTLNHYKLKDKP